MEPKIIAETQKLLVGMSFYGDPFTNSMEWNEDNQIGILWKRFIQFLSNNPEAIKHRIRADSMVEIHLETEESLEKGYFEIFVGTCVNDLEDIPLECIVKILPKTQYAIFTLKGQEITSDWESEFLTNWLQRSEYELSYQYHIQNYDHRFKGMDKLEESILDIYIPVKILTDVKGKADE